MMKNSFVFLVILLTIFQGNTQDKRFTIKGKVTSDSGALEDIHVINKNTKKATITSLNGIFQIPVKENDTLLFSAIQFKNKTVIISKQDMMDLYLDIELKTSVNSINEVIIEKPENMAPDLGLPNAGKKPLNKLEGRLNYHTKSGLPIAILAALLNKRGGIDDMYYIISGKRKKDRKLKKLIDEDIYNLYQSQQIQEIRNHFGDTFFIKTLSIPKAEISYFIKFCNSRDDVITLFSKNRKLEITDIFIKEREAFIKKLDINE